MSKEKFENFQQDIHIFIRYYKLENNPDITSMKASWDNKNLSFTFYISKDFEDLLKQGKNREFFILKMKWLLTHEDTHLQQDLKSDFKKKVKYQDIDFNSDLDQFKKYLNQDVEADAYGRQVGEILKSTFPEKSNSELADILTKDNLRNEFCKGIVSVFTDPNLVTKQTRNKFFRAAYEYILDLED